MTSCSGSPVLARIALMNPRIRRVAVLAALASTVAVPALAADPVADSRYEGQTSQGANGLRFEFRTSTDGSRVERLFTQFRARDCERARNGTQGSIRVASIAIEDGSFATRGKEEARLKPSGSFAGGTQIERYRIRGRFTTDDVAKGTLRVTVEVRNKAGDTIDTCTMGKRVTWSAERLGIEPETEE
jgi:hypothetical protein